MWRKSDWNSIAVLTYSWRKTPKKTSSWQQTIWYHSECFKSLNLPSTAIAIWMLFKVCWCASEVMARGPSDNCLLCPLTWIAQKLVKHVQKSSLPCSTCKGSVMNNKFCRWSCKSHQAGLTLVSNQNYHLLVGCAGILMGFSWTRPLGEQSDKGRLWKMALHWFTKNGQLLQVISRLNLMRGYLLYL